MSSCGDPRAHGQQRREEQVELLLDRQRPRVEQWVERLGRVEVALGEPGEVDVRHRERRGETRTGSRCMLGGADRAVRRDRHDRDGQRERRQDPAGAPTVEVGERHPSGGVDLSQQHRGDHEARDDEEDVDADESAGHREPGMERHDQEDRDPAESLDVLPPVSGLGAGRPRRGRVLRRTRRHRSDPRSWPPGCARTLRR